MSITVIVLIIEVIVILIAIVSLLLFVRWRRKKNKLTQVDQLLDNINNIEEERKASLAIHLGQGYEIGEESANELASKMVDAEKQFMHQFVKQQIEKSSISDFYENVCELLDQYLEYIPLTSAAKDSDVSNMQNSKAVTKPEETQVEENDLAEAKPKDDESLNTEDITEVIDTESVEQTETEEPDWGDAFSESGDEIDADVKASYEAEEKENAAVSEEKDDADEPDWADAFVESGDDVDESTQAGFDSEVKKD